MKLLSNLKRKDVSDWEIEQAMQPVLQELSRHFQKRIVREQEEAPEAGNQQKAANSKKARRQKPRGSKGRNTQGNGQRGSERQGREQQISGQRRTGKDITLTDEELDYLRSIIEYPNLSVTVRARKLFGYSADKGTRLKNELIEKVFLEEFSVDLGKDFGGRVKMLKLTDNGYRAIEEEPPLPLPKSRGSLEHIWWQVHIANDYAKRGYKVNIEKLLNGKSADVGVSNGKECIAVEVELSPKNVIYNLKADLDAGFARVIVACKNQRIKTEAEKQINSFLKSNPTYEGSYRIVLLSEFPFVKSLMKEVRGE